MISIVFSCSFSFSRIFAVWSKHNIMTFCFVTFINMQITNCVHNFFYGIHESASKTFECSHKNYKVDVWFQPYIWILIWIAIFELKKIIKFKCPSQYLFFCPFSMFWDSTTCGVCAHSQWLYFTQHCLVKLSWKSFFRLLNSVSVW